MNTVLVVDDDKEIVDAIEIYLKNEGIGVIKAYDGIQAIQALMEKEIHLILMDIMMPKMDGLRTTMKIREEKNIPIILISAKSEDTDKVLGLNMGADDYITKPFESMELIARVRSQLRRYEQILELKNQNTSTKNTGKYIVGDLELDTLTKQAKIQDKPIHLTPKEYQILELLIKHPGQVFSASQIYETIWKEEAINTETIMVHIRKLREKIEVNPKKPVYLKVVWGIGYKIEKV